MSHEVHLTDQEMKIIAYLQPRSGFGKEVAWEELAQFSKDPTTVKMKTIQKAVSEIRRKYQQVGAILPFDARFTTLAPKTPPPAQMDLLLKGAGQALVQIKGTPGGNVIPANSTKHPAEIDFALDPLGFKRVVTRAGSFQLNDSEWDMFKYLRSNIGRIITISELRDKVQFPNYGAKLPARWFDTIMRVINNLRRQVHGLDKRLLTVKGTETSYLFQ